MVAKIDYEKCCWKDGKCECNCCGDCGGCVEVCPSGALTRDKIVKVDEEKCTSCGACVGVCPKGAISVE